MALYPSIEPYHHDFIKVSEIHNVYYEQCGNPNGQCAVVFHGGPGGGISPEYRRFFDPSVYRVVLIDQRGAGQSTPHACLTDNTTWKLVEDVEKIRTLLNIEKWLVFGGSWGSTLALVYAEKHPERVTALVLRGIFCLRREELLWFYQEGASFVYPDAWDIYVAPIPVVERGDLMSAYHRRLTGDNVEEKRKCAAAWTLWEMTTCKLIVSKEQQLKASEDAFSEAFARIESHYFVHGGFFDYDGQIIAEASRLKSIPGVIVQGRYDMVCPLKTAWDLHKAWPNAELNIIDNAGHSVSEPGITAGLVNACDKFRNL